MQCLAADEEPFVVSLQVAAQQSSFNVHIAFEERMVLEDGIAPYPQVAKKVKVTRLSQQPEGVAVGVVVFQPVAAHGIPAIEVVAHAEAVAIAASVGESFPYLSKRREVAKMADMGIIMVHLLMFSWLVTMLPANGVSMIGLHGELGDKRHHIMVERFGQVDESIDEPWVWHILCLDESD